MWWGQSTDDFSEQANFADKSIKGFSKWDFSPLNRIYDGWMPLVNSSDDGAMVTAAVGRYVPNPWGLYDMHGNVAEWTISSYEDYPYDPFDGRESKDNGKRRVVRGGSWSDLPHFATASYRFGYPEWRKIHNVGFRIVCTFSNEDNGGTLKHKIDDGNRVN
jgi:formylglycine-generating enzyme required for sulfatase activity